MAYAVTTEIRWGRTGLNSHTCKRGESIAPSGGLASDAVAVGERGHRCREPFRALQKLTVGLGRQAIVVPLA